MTDVERILTLWRDLETTGGDYVLATVVAVHGSSYRKPGALMLLTADGRRVGTVSGGCLEGQVASRAWWLTAGGPTVQTYSTAEDDGERPYGSGCGGQVSLLLERRATADPFLAALEQAFRRRVAFCAATVLAGPRTAHRAFAGVAAAPNEEPGTQVEPADGRNDSLQHLAGLSLEKHASFEQQIAVNGTEVGAWANYRPARPGLWIFGAGDDAQPLLHLAKALGWFVSVADGRGQLATRERFPLADEVRILPIKDLPALDVPGEQTGASVPCLGDLRCDDAALVMTHSFEQDSRILASLLSLGAPPAYIGVLGPQRRTRELLQEAARLLGRQASEVVVQGERWLTR